MNRRLRIVFFSLLLAFAWYSYNLYRFCGRSPKFVAYDKALAAEGARLWQEFNCQACHQIYSLGGYLGPDLTNVYSDETKGPAYIRAIIQNGVRQMPAFNLSERQMSALLEFLHSADQSGNADPRRFRVRNNGMIEQKQD